MKKIQIYFVTAAFITAGLLTSCKKDESSSIGFKMKAVDNGTSFQKSSANSALLPIEWDTATIVVSKVSFEAEFENKVSDSGWHESYEVEYKWQGRQRIDLLADANVFATIDLPPGVYDEIELKVKSEELVSPEPNFYLSGLYLAGTGNVRVTFIVHDDFEMKQEVEDWVITVENGTLYDSMLEISLQLLFSGIGLIDLENAIVTDGRILISASNNIALYNKILENLKTNMNCDHDGNEDDD